MGDDLRPPDPGHTPTRVRIRIIGPTATTLAEHVVDDDWYALGGHRHPERKQDERDRTADAELREWLARGSRTPGSYTVLVSALDRAGGDPGKVWATVKVHHRTTAPSDPGAP